MAKSEFWQSPISALTDQLPNGLAEIQVASQINLRGNPEDPEFLTAVENILGFALPLRPNTVAKKGPLKALWLGPDEWLLVSTEQGDGVLSKLTILAETQHISVVDVDANRVVVELSGPHRMEILMKTCEVDFHSSVFGPGQVVQTLLVKSQAIIEQVEKDRFHIYIRNSFSHYLVEWLIDAFSEFES